MSLSFSKQWAKYLADRTGQTRENEAILAYVIEVFITNILNVTIILFVGFLFGVFVETITCLVTGFLFRFTAGGAHSNSPWRCAAISAIIFLTLAITAFHLSVIEGLFIDTLSALTIIVGLISIIRYAPVDSPSAPILSNVRRRRLKILSLLVLGLLATIIIIIRQNTWVYAGQVQTAIIMSILWQSFSLTNSGHHLMGFIDRITYSKDKEVK